MNKILGVLGVGIVAGAVVYMLCNKEKDENETSLKNETQRSKGKTGADVIPKDDIFIKTAVLEESQDRLQRVKNASANNIMSRHEEAAKIMKEAVSHIDANKGEPEKENVELEQISNELDELLKEK